MPNRTSIATHLSRMLQHFERARRDAGTRLEAANRHERAAWNKIENLLQAFREQLADRQAGSEIVACFLAEQLLKNLIAFDARLGGVTGGGHSAHRAPSGTHRIAAAKLVA